MKMAPTSSESLQDLLKSNLVFMRQYASERFCWLLLHHINRTEKASKKSCRHAPSGDISGLDRVTSWLCGLQFTAAATWLHPSLLSVMHSSIDGNSIINVQQTNKFTRISKSWICICICQVSRPNCPWKTCLHHKMFEMDRWTSEFLSCAQKLTKWTLDKN